MKTPTFKDLVEFVVVNKKDKTFLGYDEPTIIKMLLQGINDGLLLYLVNTEGKLTGMILAEKDELRKILFVTENLSMSLSNLRTFVKIARDRWSNYTLGWVKHGNEKFYNQNTVYNKLLKI